MEINTTVGTRSRALSGSRVMPGAVGVAGAVAMPATGMFTGATARLRVIGAKQPSGYGWPFGRRDLVQPHLVRFQNPVAPIGTDVPVAGRMRVSAPEP
jgi:hypothetical protein